MKTRPAINATGVGILRLRSKSEGECMKVSRLLLLSIALSPAILLGQKKEDILSMQRDIANMDEHVKQLQKTVDEKMAALLVLVQQSIDLSNKTAAAMTAMQHNVDQKLAEQQTKLVAPVATLGTKVDEMSGDFRSVRENVATLVRHMNDLDTKITDMSSAIRSLQTPVAPPPAVPVAGGTAQQAPDNSPPPGMSAELSYNGALRDYQVKKDESALDEFANYLKYYPTSENAPNAQYYIGQIYYRAEHWEDAAIAFDLVLEKYPKNPKTAESQYMKACALMNAKRKTQAGAEFKNFIASYPDSPRVREAHAHLRQLGLEGPTTTKRRN
jgi:TolA-binding protein